MAVVVRAVAAEVLVEGVGQAVEVAARGVAAAAVEARRDAGADVRRALMRLDALHSESHVVSSDVGMLLLNRDGVTGA